MTENEGARLLPSELMRQWRPEAYSDTGDRVSYLLDGKLLEYCLESITSRNEMHDFEIFCRKLCERTICPNLTPSTGPEGGGDSKADTETYPVDETIAELTYVGDVEAGRERWAFAFSAKKTWASKIRSDVAGIAATGRGYAKIICVTARFAPAKKRAALEDELTKTHGILITILDRSWIVEKVIEGAHLDLAHNYLHIGKEVVDSRRLGPSDYSRSQQLADIEESMARPEAFLGMEMQRATEALVAAELSRGLERPRMETEGRLDRAIRLAERFGTYRQKLEAHYAKLWTAFWWFDDFKLLNENYDAFEKLALDTDHAKHLEFLLNIMQLLFNSVIHGHLTSEQAHLEQRFDRLRDRFSIMAADVDRPNHALEARTSLLFLDVNRAMFDCDTTRLSSLWPHFSEVLTLTRGLGEFSADRLRQMIEVFGYVAADDPGYARLIDQLAEFVAERTGEAQGALILLARAKRLDFKDSFEMIRLLGRAARQLTKKEYTEALIEATTLLASAYQASGLLWASRASCIFAVASIFAVADENNDIPASIMPALMILAWAAAELRHLPDLLETVRLMRGCLASLNFDEPSEKHITESLVALDIFFAGQLLNFSEVELRTVTQLPEVLERLGLPRSRHALLYALGHGKKLRDEGSIPPSETPEQMADLFNQIASHAHAHQIDYPMVSNDGPNQRLVSRVHGILFVIDHRCTPISIPAAETIIGVIEAMFATVMALRIVAHTERFTVMLRESSQLDIPEFAINADDMMATVRWPTDVSVGSHAHAKEIQQVLIGLVATILAATCHVPDVEASLHALFEGEAVLDRVAMIVAASNSRHRLYNGPYSRLSTWAQLANTEFALEDKRPTIQRVPITDRTGPAAGSSQGALHISALRDHRQLAVLSVIDVHLWDRVGWHGAGFISSEQGLPPELVLLFTDREAAVKIFSHWRERFGDEDRDDAIYLAVVQGISEDDPAHYRVLISSRYPSTLGDPNDGTTYSMVSRMLTVTPQDDSNLSRFLEDYRRSGAYVLTPAIMADGQPDVLHEAGILKRDLIVRDASEIGEDDLEVMALGEDLFRRRFSKSLVDDFKDEG